ncbi:MAG: alpha/beta fold hydrolase [Candidatus Xenobia bacterium]
MRIRRIPGSAEQVLVVPGNPGMGRFYVPFMRALHARTGATITVLSFAGHEMPGKRYLSLQETIRLVEHLIPPAGLVIGHSVGATIALRARGSHRVVALYPYLQFDETSLRQRLLRQVAPWLAQVPIPFVASSFTLAIHEFRDLAPPPEIDWQRCQSVIYAPRDIWFPEKHHDYVPTHLMKMLPDTRHIFCLSRRESMRVATTIIVGVWFGKQLSDDPGACAVDQANIAYADGFHDLVRPSPAEGPAVRESLPAQASLMQPHFRCLRSTTGAPVL